MALKISHKTNSGSRECGVFMTLLYEKNLKVALVGIPHFRELVPLTTAVNDSDSRTTHFTSDPSTSF